MKLRIMSDLHLDFYDDPGHAGVTDDVACDVVVLAGDISTGTRGLARAADTFAAPVVYVMGNHEYYGHDTGKLLRRARERAVDRGIHLLECDELVLDGVRFLGCTLSSNFAAGPGDTGCRRHGGRSVGRCQGVSRWHRPDATASAGLLPLEQRAQR